MSDCSELLPVQIKSIDAAGGQIMATDLASKKPITINIKPDTSADEKLDDATALQMARRLNPTFQGGRAEAPAAAPEGGGGQGRGGRGGGRRSRSRQGD